MITIVITARNDQRTLAACLDSVVRQGSSVAHEIVVLDDASEDGTAALVAERYPGVRLIAEPQRVGWVGLLRRHLPELRGDAVAFLGSHCTADPDWLRSAETLIDSNLDVASGFGRHGLGRWLDRFEALSMHAEYLGNQLAEVSLLWDDNFVIRRDLLARALPATSLVLSDGTGAALLSQCLRKRGQVLPYRPELRVTHVGASLREQFPHLELRHGAQRAGYSPRRPDHALGGRIEVGTVGRDSYRRRALDSWLEGNGQGAAQSWRRAVGIRIARNALHGPHGSLWLWTCA